jgi:hypothetical protein
MGVGGNTMPLRILTLMVFTILLSCNTAEFNKAEIILVNNRNEVQPIDIKAPKFFYLTKPWKEEKLVTFDGRARYSEISFKGTNRIRIKPLFNFPRTYVESWQFDTLPQAGIITSGLRMMQHLASVDDSITKSHIPLLTWAHNEPKVILLDSDEGLIVYQYRSSVNEESVSIFIYNYKTDTMVYQTPDPFTRQQGNNIYMQFRIDDDYMFSYIATHKEEEGWKYDNFFYDWKKDEITRNGLTEFLNQNNIYVYDNCVHLGRRYLFANVRDRERENYNKLIKIDWDEGYSNVRVTDMSYLFQDFYKKGYSISRLDIIISSDGSWVTTKITDFSDFNSYDDHFVDTRVFFHMDNKYPNGISMPIFSDGKETEDNTDRDRGAFVRHPVYGMCYAREWHSKGGLYLRLYKMNDVLTVINSGSQSVPFNYDNSKNYVYTREYSYEKELIKGWSFDEEDTDMETNEVIDSIIKFCEEEMGLMPVSEPDNQLSRVELYRDHRHVHIFRDEKPRVYLYVNKSNEDSDIYFIEIDFYISEDYGSDHFKKYKIIICNQYFKFSESGNDVPKRIFWEHYDLIEEGKSAFNFFKKEMEKHRR